MPRTVTRIWHAILVKLRLSPLSLAEKCRLMFGGAIVGVLIIALLIPYIWMTQLTKNAFLNAGRSRSDYLLKNHFQPDMPSENALPSLTTAGKLRDPNDCDINWIDFSSPEKRQKLGALNRSQRRLIKDLLNQQQLDDVVFNEQGGIEYSDYARIFRADESCLNCHNPQGPARPFDRQQVIGVAVINRPASELNLAETTLGNKIWTIFAGLIALAGAIIAFYWITQRVILRPIRQLRGLVNNVAEGNLDIRSSINTRDEYEKLAGAFNHMLDNLQDSHQKLRGLNKQLDTKIVELSERNIELFKANKVKGEFLANMSHEFRTPLNSILGFAEILREKSGKDKDEKKRRYAENIITAGKSLLNMINDLLDLAKTEAGKMKMHIEKGNIAQLCNELVAGFSVMTKNKKLKVKLSIDDDIPELNTDVGKIRQVLYNFMSNAVNFTDRGGRIEIKALMADEKTIRIAVTDTGCGIASAEQERIFEKFSQADGSITRQSAGTGLGLALSKELATLLAGTIGLESEVSKGSTFWLNIPVTLTVEPKETNDKSDNAQ